MKNGVVTCGGCKLTFGSDSLPWSEWMALGSDAYFSEVSGKCTIVSTSQAGVRQSGKGHGDLHVYEELRQVFPSFQELLAGWWRLMKPCFVHRYEMNIRFISQHHVPFPGMQHLKSLSVRLIKDALWSLILTGTSWYGFSFTARSPCLHRTSAPLDLSRWALEACFAWSALSQGWKEKDETCGLSCHCQIFIIIFLVN